MQQRDHTNGFSADLHCQTCSLKPLCLPHSLSAKELDKLDHLIERKKPLHKGEVLYHPNQELTNLYAIRSGSIKTYSVTPGGEDWINQFHLAGDVIGFDAIYSGKYQTCAVALETTMVCTIPFKNQSQLFDSIPALRRQMMRLMSGNIAGNQRQQVILSHNNAEQRLANFLLDLSAAYGRRGLSRLEFFLTMSRGDIGNYLGMTVETVSRTMHNFQRIGVLSVQKKQITLHQPHQLAEIAGKQFDETESAA